MEFLNKEIELEYDASNQYLGVDLSPKCYYFAVHQYKDSNSIVQIFDIRKGEIHLKDFEIP